MADTTVSQLVDVLRTDARGALLDLLDEVDGRKVLVLDNTIMGPLNMIVKPDDLKDHGVLQFFKLSDQPIKTDCKQMIFLVKSARVELVDWVAKQILEDDREGKERTYVVLFAPRRTEQCADRLRQGNVRANVRVADCPLHFFPFDHDIISMEVPGVFHDFHVRGDTSSVFYTAKALMHLQAKFGVIPSVHAIGRAGEGVVDVMLRLRKEETTSEALRDPRPVREISQPGVPPVAPMPAQRERRGNGGEGPAAPKISDVVIIDRRVDIYSVLCSPFTYQALIDMVYGVKNNQTDVGSAEWARERSRIVRLSGDDPFYQEIRDLHIDKLGQVFQEKAKAIEKTYSEKDNVKTSSEMTEYVKKFKTAQTAHPLLEIHINLAHDLRKVIQSEEYRNNLRLEDEITQQSSQAVLETLEGHIDEQRPFHEVLRLLCLYSLVNNGVKAAQLDQLKRGILQSYGYRHLVTFSNMERVGMLRYQQGKSVWPAIKRHFHLLVEGNQFDTDIFYAYSGYAPLSIRLVQMTQKLEKGWRSCPDALNLLDGKAQELQQPLDGAGAAGGAGAAAAADQERDRSQPPVVLVCFVGGVTHAEVAALRRLTEVEGGRRRFLVMTTEFLSAKKLFESLQFTQDVVSQAPPDAARPQQSQQQAPARRGILNMWH